MKNISSFVRFQVDTPKRDDFWNYVEESIKAGAFEECKPNQEKSFGFTVWDDPFNSVFDGSSYKCGEYLIFNFRHDCKKIPSMLFKKYVREKIESYREKNAGKYPPKNIREEYKEQVHDWLLNQTLAKPSFSGIIWNTVQNWIILCNTSSKISSAFLEKIEDTFELFPMPLTCSNWATQQISITPQEKQALNDVLSISDETSDGAAGKIVGFEFLTWLWYITELDNYTITLPSNKNVEVYLGDKLSLCLPTDEKENISCATQANALIEAKTALQQGKMVKSIQLIIRVNDENEYTVGIDTSLMTFKGLKTPKPAPSDNADDNEGAFLEKMFFIEEIFSVLNVLYKNFLSDRLSTSWESTILPEMKKWVNA